MRSKREQMLREVALVSVGLVFAVPALAADADTIVVTGAALVRAEGERVRAVQVIDGDALTGSAASRLETVLQSATGFQMFRRTDSRSANPTSQGASLRGIGGNASSRALVLLDGVPVADPFAGWIAWPSIRPESLGRVRITTGGGAGAFGAGALTGAIELESAGPGERPTLSLSARYGSRAAVDLGGGSVISLGSGFVAVDAGYSSGDGYVLLPEDQRGSVDIPANYRQYGGAVRAVFRVGETTELQTRVAAFEDERTRGIAIVDSANSGADASLKLVSRGRLPWEALVYVQARDFSSRFARIDAARANAIPTLDQYGVPATGLGAKVELRPRLGDHQLRLGSDWRRASGTTRERFNFAGGSFTRLREAGGNSDVAGFFVEDDWQATNRLLLSLGARLDHWSLTGGRLQERTLAGATLSNAAFADRDGWEPTARAGLAYELTPALTLRGSAYLGFRIPTLNELYRPFRVGADATAANAALRPERLRGAEAGADFQPLTTARLGITVFANRASNAIGNVTLGRGPGVFPGVGFVAGTYRQRLNLDAIDAWGIEAHGAWQAGSWSLAASYALTDSRVDASGPAIALDGRRPAQVPRHQASARLGFQRGVFAANLALRYDGARFEDDLESLRLDEALTVDATTRIRLGGGLSLNLAAENLFNARIEAGRTSDGLVDRGQPRSLWIGLGWAR